MQLLFKPLFRSLSLTIPSFSLLKIDSAFREFWRGQTLLHHIAGLTGWKDLLQIVQGHAQRSMPKKPLDLRDRHPSEVEDGCHSKTDIMAGLACIIDPDLPAVLLQMLIKGRCIELLSFVHEDVFSIRIENTDLFQDLLCLRCQRDPSESFFGIALHVVYIFILAGGKSAVICRFFVHFINRWVKSFGVR